LTFDSSAVALTVASLNWSRTVPAGTPEIWKYPELSTVAERLVPATVTVNPDAGVPLNAFAPLMVPAPE
jgi:hypothetical protein